MNDIDYAGRRVTIGLGGACVLLGLVVMIGWFARLQALTQILPEFAAMQFNTALCLALLGAGLIGLSVGGDRSTAGAASLAILVSAATLLEYAIDVDLGLDQLFVEHYLAPDASHPGRMSVLSAASFVCSGVGLLIAASRWHGMLVAASSSLVLAIASTAFIGYLLGVRADYGWLSVNRMALHTAFGFMLFSTGMLHCAWRRAPQRIPRWLAVPTTLGLTSFAVLIWMAIDGQASGEGDIKRAVAVLLLVMTLLFAVAVGVALRLASVREQQTIAARSAARTLADTNTRLQHSNEKLKRFAWAASHDLQEPLRKVFSFLQLLERRIGADLDDKSIQYMHFTRDAAQRMQILVQEVLEYSRLQGDAALESVVLDDALDEVLALLSDAVETAGARIERTPLPVVSGVRRQLVQLLQNLVSNALKYRREGVAPVVHIGCQAIDDQIAVSIRDNGIGIEPQYHEKIFEAFTRLHGRAQYAGTGIGLAMCREIVERHGGALTVESALGAGSTFTVVLPISPGSTPG